MKRLLLISYPFPPNATAGAVRSERFARYLPRFGWGVEVVTIEPRGDLFHDRGRLQGFDPSVRIHFTKTLDPWLRLQPWKPNFVLLRAFRSAAIRLCSFPDHMIFWIPFVVRTGLRIRKASGFDAIYSTSPPESPHIAGLILSLLASKPLVADFRDPWTQNAYKKALRGHGMIGKAQFAVEKFLEQVILKQSRLIFANTMANRINVLGAFPFLSPDKVLYVPNGWEPFEQNCSRFDAQAPYTIVHAGAFYSKFKPFALLHALGHWQRGLQPAGIPPLRDVRIILLGCRDEGARRLVAELQLAEIVEMRPWVALEEARQTMCSADALWTTLGTGPESATYVPSKIYEYISAKRPILGFFAKGEAAEIIRQTGTGIVFSTDDPVPIISTLYEGMVAKSKGERYPAYYAPNSAEIEKRAVYHVMENVAVALDGILQDSHLMPSS